jgi:hypothetical protein
MGTSTAKEGGEPAAEDCATPLLLDTQSALDRDDEVIRQAHVVEGLGQRFDIALGLALLVLLAFCGMHTTACEGMGVLGGGSCGLGHGVFLHGGCQQEAVRRKPCPSWGQHGACAYEAHELCVYIFEKS